MSRGLGRLQREILLVVEANAAGGPNLPPGKVASMTSDQIRHHLPFTALPRAVRRSLVSLEDRGHLVSIDPGERTARGTFAPLSWTTPAEFDRAVEGLGGGLGGANPPE